jgi:uncharacterized membrane protein YgcG
MNQSRAPRSVPSRALVGFIGLLSVLSLLTACSSKKGPDLAKQIGGLPSLTKTTTPPEGLDLQGSDGTWLSDGTEEEVANVISAKVRPDERSSSVEGGTFMLYRNGTVWVTPAGNKTAVVLYKDNQRAYSRHGAFLAANTGWNSRMGSYRSGNGSSGSSGGNSFRGGGSGSGK